MQLETGDKVRLKSGGPEMTVRGIESYDAQAVRCTWFVDRTLHEALFEKSLLVAAKKEGRAHITAETHDKECR